MRRNRTAPPLPRAPSSSSWIDGENMKLGNLRWIVALPLVLGLIGCSAVSERQPTTGGYIQLGLVAEPNAFNSGIRVIQIQRIGDSDGPYIPSGKSAILWLRPGKYIARLVCDRKPGEKSAQRWFLVEAHTTALENGDYSFEVDLDRNGDNQYGLDCEISDTGQVYVIFGTLIHITEH